MGHTILVAAPQDSPLYERSRDEGFKVFPLSFIGLHFPRDYKQLVKICREEQPHIVTAHGLTDARVALPAAQKAGGACRIFCRHTSTPVKNSFQNRLILKKWSHYVFTTAPVITRHLQGVFNLKETRIFSIPNGIAPPEQLPDRDRARRETAEALNLPPRSRFMGYSGPLSHIKGVDLLIQVLGGLKRRIDHHLLLAGSGEESFCRELEERMVKHGLESRVHFLGEPEDPWQFYRALDAFIMPSRTLDGNPFEDIPQPLMEAMYASCPVVGSRTGGICDIVHHNETGLLFEPGNAQDLSRTLCDTLEQPATARERVHDARNLVREAHTIDRAGRDLIRIYRLHQVWQDQKQMGRSLTIRPPESYR